MLILTFARIPCHYLLITKRAKLLNFLMLKTATIVGRGHRSRTLLNFLASSFIRTFFWKRSFTTPCLSSCFHFRSRPLILRYIPRQLVICIRPIPLSCALCNSALGLQVRVINRQTYNYLQMRRHVTEKTTSRLKSPLLDNLRTNFALFPKQN